MTWSPGGPQAPTEVLFAGNVLSFYQDYPRGQSWPFLSAAAHPRGGVAPSSI